MHEARRKPAIEREHGDSNTRRHTGDLWLKRVGALVLLASAATAHAPIFRCTDADGHVVFSDTSCGSKSEKVDVVQSSGGLSPIQSDGLSAQERSDLGAAEARVARSNSQPAQGGGQAPAAAAPSSAPALHGSY